MILKYVCIYIYYHVLYVLCVFFLMYFFSNLYLYNTVLFCVNKDIIISNVAAENKRGWEEMIASTDLIGNNQARLRGRQSETSTMTQLLQTTLPGHSLPS